MPNLEEALQHRRTMRKARYKTIQYSAAQKISTISYDIVPIDRQCEVGKKPSGTLPYRGQKVWFDDEELRVWEVYPKDGRVAIIRDDEVFPRFLPLEEVQFNSPHPNQGILECSTSDQKVLAHFRSILRSLGPAKFIPTDETNLEKISSCWGWIVKRGPTVVWYIKPDMFAEKFCAGFEKKIVTRTLVDLDVIEVGYDGHPWTRLKIGNTEFQVYGITNAIFEGPGAQQESPSLELMLNGEFTETLNRLSKEWPEGQLRKAVSNTPNLKQQIDEADHRLSGVWALARKGQVSVEQFKASLAEWELAHLKAADKNHASQSPQDRGQRA